MFCYRGVPAVVDFAAMREAVKDLGGDPAKINPLCPADLVIDHSVQVDIARRYPQVWCVWHVKILSTIIAWAMSMLLARF